MGRRSVSAMTWHAPKGTSATATPPIAGRETWQQRSDARLVRAAAHTRGAAARRRLSMHTGRCR